MDPQGLPDTHDEDPMVAKYVLDHQLGLSKHSQVPIPKSKTGYIYLASLQKKKQIDIFEPGREKPMVPYSLKPDIFK